MISQVIPCLIAVVMKLTVVIDVICMKDGSLGKVTFSVEGANIAQAEWPVFQRSS